MLVCVLRSFIERNIYILPVADSSRLSVIHSLLRKEPSLVSGLIIFSVELSLCILCLDIGVPNPARGPSIRRCQHSLRCVVVVLLDKITHTQTHTLSHVKLRTNVESHSFNANHSSLKHHIFT